LNEGDRMKKIICFDTEGKVIGSRELVVKLLRIK